MLDEKNPIIELRNASKSYLGVTAVKNMSLALYAGRVM
jgi:ABC-type sugar transport system ATPase subunit